MGRPSLRLLLMPTTPTDMDSDTMDLDMPDSDTVDSDMPDSDTMDSDTECTARGRPRLSLRLMLMPTTWADTMDSDTVSDTTDSDTPDSDTMDSDTECTARGRPRLSLRLLRSLLRIRIFWSRIRRIRSRIRSRIRRIPSRILRSRIRSRILRMGTLRLPRISYIKIFQ